MSNKIETYGPQMTGAPARVRTAETAGTAGGERVAAVAGSDSVKLTGDAVLLQQLEKAAAEAPVVDERRVAEVRQALADGSYRVDPQTVAAKLARMEWEFAQR